MADWDKEGRAAGPLRNARLVAAATHVLAFCPDGVATTGTMDTLKKASAVKLPCWFLTRDGELEPWTVGPTRKRIQHKAAVETHASKLSKTED